MTPRSLASRALPTAVLLAACATDVRARRIPNALVLALLGGALVRASLAAWTTVPTPGLAAGPVDALLGAACGLALWLPFYVAGAFGAGDVKLFAAAAAGEAAAAPDLVRELLAAADADALSPREALELVYRLKKAAVEDARE